MPVMVELWPVDENEALLCAVESTLSRAVLCIPFAADASIFALSRWLRCGSCAHGFGKVGVSTARGTGLANGSSREGAVLIDGE